MSENEYKSRALALTPSWSVACVLTIFVAMSFLIERSIHRLSSWLLKTNRKPLFEALEKMKEELMLLGFISLLLTATSKTIANICISDKFYRDRLSPCSKSEAEESEAEDDVQKNRRLMSYVSQHSLRRLLSGAESTTCKEGYEPFVSYEGLEQLHRFIFVMAITHISYSCLTMLLAIVKIHTWRKWEDEAHVHKHNAYPEMARETTVHRQSMFVKFHASNPLARNWFLVWVACFFRQFGQSAVHADYLTLRMGFITNHNLASTFDFHSYMIRSMEEEFPRVVGVSPPLWGFVVAFMLFNVTGSNLYFWMAIVPLVLVLVVGAKLQHIMATLAWENAGITGFFAGTKLNPRDDLFWFRKPKLVLALIHFILFQNAFELASFFWYWWQFGYESCFIRNHLFLYIRLVMGFAGQFLCSYSTLPLYALVTQMGTNYKAALIPRRIRETIHSWKKEAKKKRRDLNDDSTVHTQTSTVISLDDDLSRHYQSPAAGRYTENELPPTSIITTRPTAIQNNSCADYGARPLWAYLSLTPNEEENQFNEIPTPGTKPGVELQSLSIGTTTTTVDRENTSSSSTRSVRLSTSLSPTTTIMGLEEGSLRSSTMPPRR